MDWFHEEDAGMKIPEGSLPFLIQPKEGSKAYKLDIELPLRKINIGDIDDDMLMVNTRSEAQLLSMKRETDVLKEIMERIQEEEKVVIPENEPPNLPPKGLLLSNPTPEEVEEDRKMVRHLHQQYYKYLNDKNVLGLMTLWRDEGAMQGLHYYYGEDKVLHGYVMSCFVHVCHISIQE